MSTGSFVSTAYSNNALLGEWLALEPIGKINIPAAGFGALELDLKCTGLEEVNINLVSSSISIIDC